MFFTFFVNILQIIINTFTFFISSSFKSIVGRNGLLTVPIRLLGRYYVI